MRTYQRALGTWLLLASACSGERLQATPFDPADDGAGFDAAYSQQLDARLEVHGARDDDGYLRAQLGTIGGKLLLELEVGEPSHAHSELSYTYYAGTDGNPAYDELSGVKQLGWKAGTEISPRTASELLTFLYANIAEELRGDRADSADQPGCPGVADALASTSRGACCDSYQECFTRTGCVAESWFSSFTRRGKKVLPQTQPNAELCDQCNTQAWECIKQRESESGERDTTDDGPDDQVDEVDAAVGEHADDVDGGVEQNEQPDAQASEDASDDEATTEDTDHEGTDVEDTDTEESDSEDTDVEGTDVEGTDVEGADVEDTDPEDSDVEDIDSDYSCDDTGFCWVGLGSGN